MQAMLALLESGADSAVKGHLVRQKSKGGKIRLYHAVKDPQSRRTFYKRIHPDDEGLLKTLHANRLYEKYAAALKKNSDLLEQLLAGYQPVDFSEWLPAVPASTWKNGTAVKAADLSWEQLKASAGNYRPEGLIYEADGRKFRSKGEAMHAMCFANAGLEYIYEPEIRIDGIVLRPDFVVRNKRTGRIYFWEFFGMMDVAEYQEAFVRKLPALLKLGIVPGYNLICTCEFKGICTLSISDIQAKIQAYLL